MENDIKIGEIQSEINRLYEENDVLKEMIDEIKSNAKPYEMEIVKNRSRIGELRKELRKLGVKL